MIKVIITLLIVVFIGFGAVAQNKSFLLKKFSNDQIKSELFLYLAKNYNSNALAILKSSKKYSDYTHWAHGKSHAEMLRSFGTVIHETCHSYNFNIGGFDGFGYYISPDIQIVVSETKVFKSNELDNEIPKEWKKNIFRYKTYIKGELGMGNISSIKNGIYGLMDEFDAYYQDTRASVELFDYYKTFASYSDPEAWTEYLSNCYSTLYAYYEFRLFMAWYLKYAKQKHTGIYLSISQNKNLKVVYTLINNAYIKTIDQYYKNREFIIDNINDLGIKTASISDQYLYIKTIEKSGSSSYGIGVPDMQIEYLLSLFTKEDEKVLNQLFIEGLNEENYLNYL